MAYSIEIFNALGETITVTTVPESLLEELTADEILQIQSVAQLRGELSRFAIRNSSTATKLASTSSRSAIKASQSPTVFLAPEVLPQKIIEDIESALTREVKSNVKGKEELLRK